MEKQKEEGNERYLILYKSGIFMYAIGNISDKIADFML